MCADHQETHTGAVQAEDMLHGRFELGGIIVLPHTDRDTYRRARDTTLRMVRPVTKGQ